MLSITFPEPDFKIKKEKGREYIFDAIRKQWIVLTPEEWVRQNFINYLVKTLNYPVAMIAVEKEIMLGELKKRFDILVYDKEHTPWMMIECKAQEVPLTENVLQQVLRYNISVPVKYLLITNGNYHFGWRKTEGQLSSVLNMPEWQ